MVRDDEKPVVADKQTSVSVSTNRTNDDNVKSETSREIHEKTGEIVPPDCIPAKGSINIHSREHVNDQKVAPLVREKE